MAKGFFLAPNVYVDAQGGIWRDTEQSGLGFNWEKVGNYFAPIALGVAGWIATKSNNNQAPQYQQQPPVGAYAGANSQGLFGGIDTTTLVLILGAALLYISTPKGK